MSPFPRHTKYGEHFQNVDEGGEHETVEVGGEQGTHGGTQNDDGD